MDAITGNNQMGHDLIAIGGSAGSGAAVMSLARALPAGLPAAVLIAIHGSPEGPGLLANLLDAIGPLRAVMAEEGQRFEHGWIYVAPPDRHLLVEANHLHVRRGPLENRSRPAIDPLFRSAAVCCTTRVIGVVLSGMLNDGTSGLMAIKHCGGLTVVQDPRDASFPEMPRNALAKAEPDHVVPLADMASLLVRLTASPRPPAPADVPEEIRIEALIAAQELTVMPDQHPLGAVSPLTCPDCHGALVEIRDGDLLRFRCHTGHAFTLEALALTQSEAWERTLYAAMRAQQEQAMLARYMVDQARLEGHAFQTKAFARRERDYEDGAEVIRRLLAEGNGYSVRDPEDPS